MSEPVHARNAKGQPVCGAKLRRKNATCQSPVVMVGGRCRLHGGESLRGMAHPSFTTGRYSKVLTGQMLEAYTRAANDPDMLNLSAELAILTARIEELMGRVGTGESAAAWDDMAAAMEDFDRANLIKDRDGITLAWKRMHDILNLRQGDYAAWSEIIRLFDQYRKLAVAEAKRRQDMRMLVSADEALAFITRVSEVIREEVTDPRVLNRIHEAVNELAQRKRIEPGY